MMVAGFIRARMSPSVLLLLLLAFTTTTTGGGVQRADGASYSSQDDSTDNTESCPTEEFACLDDARCSACLDVASTNSAEVNDCVELASSSTSSSESSGCTSHMNAPCCVDEASGYECLENELFAEYTLCVLESEGCYVEEITCDAGGSALDTASNGATTKSRGGSTLFAFVGSLLVCWLSLALWI